MTPMKKTIISIIVAGIVIGVGYATYVTYVSGGYEDGAPIPEIIIRVTEAETNNVDSITITPGRNINAATTISTTLFAINPTTAYNVEFIVRYTVTPPAGLPAGTALVGYATLTGVGADGGVTAYIINQASYTATGNYSVSTSPIQLVNNTGVAQFTSALAFNKNVYPSNGVVNPLHGATLGGSTWTLVCNAQTTYAGTGAYQGTTTVTINMSLGGENLVVTATGVDVTVTTP